MKMNFKFKTILLSAAALTSVVFLAGAPSSCDPENWTDPERYDELQRPTCARVSIHRIIKYRQGNQTEAVIPTYTKQQVTVDSSWLSAREIEKIELAPHAGKQGYYDLILTLTQKGRREWIMLSNANMHEDMAFVIDGVFYRSFRPAPLLNEKDVTVRIDGPFDQATARELAYHAEFNYMKINKK